MKNRRNKSYTKLKKASLTKTNKKIEEKKASVKKEVKKTYSTRSTGIIGTKEMNGRSHTKVIKKVIHKQTRKDDNEMETTLNRKIKRVSDKK